MPWVKLDSSRATHRKLRKAGYAARGLDEAAMCQTCEDGADGFISDDALAMLHAAHGLTLRQGRQLVAILCSPEIGRWVRDDKHGGYIIHDYLVYNPTRAEWDALVAKKAVAGSKGGKAKAEAHHQPQAVAPATSNAESDDLAVSSRSVPDEAKASSFPEAVASDRGSKPFFAEATQLLRDWVEAESPHRQMTKSSWPGKVAAIRGFLDNAGWSVDQLRPIVLRCAVISTDAIQLEIGRSRRENSRNPNVQRDRIRAATDRLRASDEPVVVPIRQAQIGDSA